MPREIAHGCFVQLLGRREFRIPHLDDKGLQVGRDSHEHCEAGAVPVGGAQVERGAFEGFVLVAALRPHAFLGALYLIAEVSGNARGHVKGDGKPAVAHAAPGGLIAAR